MQIMGFNPLDSDLLRMLSKKKIGQWRPDAIKVAGSSVKSLSRNFARAANTYTARGIRKWLMAGPLRSPIKNIHELNPSKGKKTAGAEWKILDGDAIIDAGINISWPFRLQECLMYGLPGSNKTRMGSIFYLALRIYTRQKDLCGQLLVGIR